MLISFETEIIDASEHMLSLMDASPKEVVGTTCILLPVVPTGCVGGCVCVYVTW